MYAIIEQSERMIKADINKLILNILNDEYVKAFVIDANQERLLKYGVDIEGKKLKTYGAKGNNAYSDYTIIQRGLEGKQSGHVDLNWKGDFYNSMRTELKNNEYGVVANFQKSDGNISDNLDTDLVLGFDDKTIEGIIEFIQAMIATEQLKAFGIE